MSHSLPAPPPTRPLGPRSEPRYMTAGLSHLHTSTYPQKLRKKRQSPVRRLLDDFKQVHSDKGTDDFSTHPRRRRAEQYYARLERRQDEARAERLRSELQSASGQRRHQVVRAYEQSIPSPQSTFVNRSSVKAIQQRCSSVTCSMASTRELRGSVPGNMLSGDLQHHKVRPSVHARSWSASIPSSHSHITADINRKPVGNVRGRVASPKLANNHIPRSHGLDIQTPSMESMYQSSAAKKMKSVPYPLQTSPLDINGSNEGHSKIGVVERSSSANVAKKAVPITGKRSLFNSWTGGAATRKTKGDSAPIDSRASRPPSAKKTRPRHGSRSSSEMTVSPAASSSQSSINYTTQHPSAGESIPAILTPGSPQSHRDTSGRAPFETLSIPGGLGLEELIPQGSMYHLRTSPQPELPRSSASSTTAVETPRWGRALYLGPRMHSSNYVYHNPSVIPEGLVSPAPLPYPLNKADQLMDWQSPIVTRRSTPRPTRPSYSADPSPTLSPEASPEPPPHRLRLRTRDTPYTDVSRVRTPPTRRSSNTTQLLSPQAASITQSPEFRAGQRLVWYGICAMVEHMFLVLDPASKLNRALKREDVSIVEYMAAFRAWLLFCVYAMTLCYAVMLGTRMIFLTADVARCVAAPFQLALRIGGSVFRL